VMPAPATGTYQRADWWDEKKKEYAEGVVKHRAGQKQKVGVAAGGVAGEFTDFPEAIDDQDDDLPF